MAYDIRCNGTGTDNATFFWRKFSHTAIYLERVFVKTGSGHTNEEIDPQSWHFVQSSQTSGSHRYGKRAQNGFSRTVIAEFTKTR